MSRVTPKLKGLAVPWITNSYGLRSISFAAILLPFLTGCTSRPSAVVIRQNNNESRIEIHIPGIKDLGLFPHTRPDNCEITIKSDLLQSNRPISSSEFLSTHGMPLGDNLGDLAGYVFLIREKSVILVGISCRVKMPLDGSTVYIPLISDEIPYSETTHE